MNPFRGAPMRDPDGSEIKYLVGLALLCITAFFVLGSYNFSRREKPKYVACARALFDPGTWHVRYVWFPSRYMMQGNINGHAVMITTLTNGRRVGRHVFLEWPARHILAVSEPQVKRLRPAERALVGKLVSLPDFRYLSVRAHNGLSWSALTDNRPLSFGLRAGINLCRMDPDLSPASLRRDFERVLAAAQSGL